MGYDICHIPIGPFSPDADLGPRISALLNNKMFHIDAPSIRIWHQHDLGPFYGKGPRIGFPIFELETFDKTETHNLKNPDHLFCCSNWAKDVLDSQIDGQTTSVVPLGYDPEIFFPAPPSTNMGVTMFGNFGKFEIRKGHDVLPEIFNKAFTPNDNVVLCMMPHNFFLNQEETNSWTKHYMDTPLGKQGKIKFINRMPTQSGVASVMNAIDCGIFPSRAEGWNLEALELLACGKHLIITNCTAHTEFCNAENSRLVEMNSGMEKAIDHKFFDGTKGRWKKITNDEIDQMVHHMREVHRLNSEGNLEQNHAGLETAQKFTWEKTAEKIHDELGILQF